MEFIKKETEELTLIISYESSIAEKIKCKFGDKIEDIITNFASKINENHSSFLILYNGAILKSEDLKRTFLQKMNKNDIERKNMNILIYKRNPTVRQNNDIINIILIIDSKDSIIIKGQKNEIIKDIIKKNSAKIGDINNMIFKYGNNEIQLDQKFEDIANARDKLLSGITLLAYTKVNENESHIRTQTNNTFINESQTNISNDPIQNNENCLKSFLKNHKKLLLIISSLLIAIIIAVIIIIVKLKKSGEDIVKNIDSTVPSDDPFKTDEPSDKPSDKPIKSENINTDFPRKYFNFNKST